MILRKCGALQCTWPYKFWSQDFPTMTLNRSFLLRVVSSS
jgi:hypothetical protein